MLFHHPAVARHEVNHVTEVAHKTIGDLSDMWHGSFTYFLLFCGDKLMSTQYNSHTSYNCTNNFFAARFCFSSLLTKGSLYHDLITSCQRIFMKNLQISYEPPEVPELMQASTFANVLKQCLVKLRPNSQHKAYARSVLEAATLQSLWLSL